MKTPDMTVMVKLLCAEKGINFPPFWYRYSQLAHVTFEGVMGKHLVFKDEEGEFHVGEPILYDIAKGRVLLRVGLEYHEVPTTQVLGTLEVK